MSAKKPLCLSLYFTKLRCPKTMAFGQLSASLPTEVYAVHNQSETVSSASKSYKTLTNKENEAIGHRF